MVKKFTSLAVSLIVLWMIPSLLANAGSTGIKRLTYSGNNGVAYPSLSDDGRKMLYVLQVKEEDKSTEAIMLLDVENGKEKELFRSGTLTAPAPHTGTPLMVGSKPPLISGNGRVAVFSLSLGEPENNLDHFLCVVQTETAESKIFSFPIEALKGKDLNSLEFESPNWERVSNYAVDKLGIRIACLLKGHLGPRRYGDPSGIILLDAPSGKQKTILAPEWKGTEWEWPDFPRCPLLGGGWAFCLSGDGTMLLFGAQSSEEKTDYDLYALQWSGEKMNKITDFNDRWFSLADISDDGKKVVFFYNGRKKQGMGTYLVHTDGSGLKYLESKLAPRIELFDMSGDGRTILYKNVYKGMALDLDTGKERVAFDEKTPGYQKGLMPMDFPRIPAFWGPRIMSFKGDRVLLVGPPEGKDAPEIYMLQIDMN